VRLEISQMLGNLDLRLAEDLLKMTDTKWLDRKQIQNTKARFIAETAVNGDQLHYHILT
jgi:hypothetical protein